MAFLVMWVLIVFVSVLAHELGHALVARRFGAGSEITLFALGGLTSWEAPRGLSPWRRVAVAASGSAVGFVLGGMVWLAVSSGLVEVYGLVRRGVSLFIVVNVFWGVLNWLPIRPLDGGHIFSGILQALLGKTGERIADVLFPMFTLAAGVWAWQEGLVFAGLLALFVLLDELRRWWPRAPRQGPPPGEDFRLFDD